MKGDMQILTYEYCQNHGMARFAMNALKDYECLVLETLEKKQSMFIWKAQLLGAGCQNTELSSPSESQIEDVDDSRQEHRPDDHQKRISSAEPNNESGAHGESELLDQNK